MKRSARLGKVKVTADGEGVVSHAGAELLREMAGFTGLIDCVGPGADRHLRGPCRSTSPASVLADLAVAIADGADSISDLKALRDQPVLFGPVASTPTAWRVLDRVSEAHCQLLRAGRADGARRGLGGGRGTRSSAARLCLDIDATIVIAHSEKELASADVEAHVRLSSPRLLLGPPRDLLGRRRWPASCAREEPGPNTTADHISVLDHGPRRTSRSGPAQKGRPAGSPPLVRADAAGATHGFAAFCRERGVAFSFGFAIDENVRKAIVSLEENAWVEATEDDGEVRDGAWVAEITDGLDLSAWPEGSRVIVRKERPTPAPSSASSTRSKDCATPPSSAPRERPTRPRLVRSPALEVRHRTTPASRTGYARPRRRACATCRASWRPRTTPGSSACWPPSTSSLVQAHLLFRRARPRPLRDRRLSLPRSCTWRPGSPGAVASCSLRLDRTWAWSKQLALGFTRLRAAFA